MHQMWTNGRYDKVTEMFQEKLPELLERQQNTGLCHGDFRMSNIMIPEDTEIPLMIDFQYSRPSLSVDMDALYLIYNLWVMASDPMKSQLPFAKMAILFAKSVLPLFEKRTTTSISLIYFITMFGFRYDLTPHFDQFKRKQLEQWKKSKSQYMKLVESAPALEAAGAGNLYETLELLSSASTWVLGGDSDRRIQNGERHIIYMVHFIVNHNNQ